MYKLQDVEHMPLLTVVLVLTLMAMQGDTTNNAASDTCNTNNEVILPMASSFYSLRPLSSRFGAEAIGLDLSLVNLHNNTAFINQLKVDLIQHRALLFRQQLLTGQRQVDISNILGTIESTFYKHPKAPHPDIFRVSNSDDEGCTQVGRSGWHIDGTFQLRPFMYQTMYFESVAEGGDTYFVPLREFYQSLPKATQERYNRLWMVSNRQHRPVVHPLVYQHPFRPDHEPTMLFHCGEPFVQGWLEEKEEPEVQLLDEDDKNETQTHETNQEGGNEAATIRRCQQKQRQQQYKRLPPRPLQEELTRELESRLDDIGLQMKWQPGDFLITDNLGLVHYASPGTQADSRRVGLRVLHRTTIVGGPETVPQKADGRRSFIL